MARVRLPVVVQTLLEKLLGCQKFVQNGATKVTRVSGGVAQQRLCTSASRAKKSSSQETAKESILVHSRELTWKPKRVPIRTIVSLKQGDLGFHVSLGERNYLKVFWESPFSSGLNGLCEQHAIPGRPSTSILQVRSQHPYFTPIYESSFQYIFIIPI